MGDAHAHVTDALLEEGQSRNGGWSERQLALIGVDWPPPKGWRRLVVGRPISQATAELFRAMKDDHIDNAQPKMLRR